MLYVASIKMRVTLETISSCRLFQVCGAATENAPPPTVDSLTAGTVTNITM